MSHALHLVSNKVPDCRYLSYSGVSGRAVTLSPCSSRSDQRICTQVKIRATKCSSRGISIVCRAGSSGHRRNPDFPRQRNGFQGRNRQNEDKENFDSLDESEMISSKNGPLLSLSGNTKYQATAAPGPREKEIVELFRKVQAKLRERAAAKEDKRTEALQRKGGKESETVDSLLKLLRKHSVEQGKKKNSNGSSRDMNFDTPEVNGSSNEDKSSTFFRSNDRVRSETGKEPYAPSLSRPASNFRRKSPVPQIKYQAIYPGEETIDSVTHVNSDRKRNLSSTESHPSADLVPEIEEELELESEPELEPESIYKESVLDELSEDESSDIDEDVEEQIEHEDLSALKLPELRALAKSRGLKGFSKMKKGDLVSILSSSG